MRSAVSAVVRTTSAERAAAGAGAAPSAARMRSFSAGSRTVIRIASGQAADDEPLRLELVGAAGEARTTTKFAGGRRAVEAGGEQRLAHPLALGDRLLDVEPRLAERGGGDPRGGRADRRGIAAAVELGGELGRRDRVADAQRREAERLRQRADRDQVRRRRDQRDDRLAAVLEVRLVDDDGGVRHRAASAAIASGSTSSPVGLFGLQTQTRCGVRRVVRQLRALDAGSRSRTASRSGCFT